MKYVSVPGKVQMARLARIDSRLAELEAESAELHARRAAIFAELADGASPGPHAIRREPRPHRAELPPISDVDAARAERALQRGAARRRVRA